MKCRFKYLFALLFIPVLFGCNDIYDDMYNDMKVSLTDHELHVSTYTHEYSMYIHIDTYGTQTNWKISGVPNWIKLSSTSGTRSETVTLQISPSITNQERHATLTVTSSDMPGSFEILVKQQWAHINGSGKGTIDYPYDCIAANSYVSCLYPNVESEDDIFIRGHVYQIEQQYDEKSGIASFIISNDIDGSNQFRVSGALYLGNQKYSSNKRNLLIGDYVVICGKVINKNGTYQTVENKTYLYSLNETTDANDASVVLDNIKSISYVLENGVYGGRYRIQGVCTSITDSYYGNFCLQDDTGKIYIYGSSFSYYPNQFLNNNIHEGDVLIIEAELLDRDNLVMRNADILDIQRK